MVVKDYMGRVIRIHKNGFVTTYEYPTSGDRTPTNATCQRPMAWVARSKTAATAA